MNLPPCFKVTLSTSRLSSKEETEELAALIGEWIKTFAESLNLERLEQVIVADDYVAALQAVDRGDPQFATLAPTENEHAHGGAMTFPVVRGADELWSVAVIWTPVLLALLNADEAAYQESLGLLLHELAHAHCFQVQINSCPDGWRFAMPANRSIALWRDIVEPCPTEYEAQKRSAFLTPGAGMHFLKMLTPALTEIGTQLCDAREVYKQNYDLNLLWTTISPRLGFLFQSIGYFAGQLDGLLKNSDQHTSWIIQFEQSWSELSVLPAGWLLEECRQTARVFSDAQTWPGDEAYDALYSTLEKILNQHGLFFDWSWGRLNIVTEPILEQDEDS